MLNGRDRAKLAAAAADLPGAARWPSTSPTTPPSARPIDGFEAERGPIDILVNNAGVQHRAPLEDFPAEDFERLLRSQRLRASSTSARRARGT